MLSSKCSWGLIKSTLCGGHQAKSPFLIKSIRRGIAMTSVDMKHYKILGLSANATQNEIKSAYYKLSMQYHPDKNKGCESAGQMFREINAAYEVLGNRRLRKLYDKGIIHTASPQYAKSEYTYEEPVEDDPQTKFYKARERRSEVPHVKGQAPIYDFDEWSRAHYGSSFDRKQRAKKRHEFKEAQKKDFRLSTQNEILLFGMLALIVMVNILWIKNHDQDKTKKPSNDR